MPSAFEFPTDNPELFTARPPSVFPRAPEVRASEPERTLVEARVALVSDSDDDADIEIVDSFDDADFAGAAAADPVATYVTQLQEVARSLGAGESAVAMLPGLLGFERFDASLADEDTLRALSVAGLVHSRDGGFSRVESVVSVAQAWRVALVGLDPDFSACGSNLLDEWSAEIVAKLAGAPHKAELARRELRARGVAAFGLVEAA